MGKIQLDPSKIRGVQASLDRTLVDDVTTTSAGNWVEDSSQEQLDSCMTAVKSSSEGIADAVVNLNNYLDSVADAFESTDSALSGVIQDVTVSAIPAKQKGVAATIRSGRYYKSLK